VCDGVLLVQRGQHHGDAAPPLGLDEFVDRPGRIVPGVGARPAGRTVLGTHTRPRKVRAGGRKPWIAAIMSTTRRVCATSWTRKTRAPAAADHAVAARVPSSRS